MESSGNGQQRYWNTFLYSVKASIFKGFQREATFYYPIWWGDLPAIVKVFLESYDFTGKTVIPFCTHAGSGLSGTQGTVETLCDGATIEDGLAVRGKTAQEDVASAESSVTEWLRGLGFVE